MKKIAGILAIFLTVPIVLNMPKIAILNAANDEHTKKIFEQERLISEAKNLVKKQQFNEAIKKYKEATNPELLIYPYDEDRPILLMAKVLEFQDKYEEALRIIENVLKKYPNHHGYDQSWDGKKLELEALIKARDANSPQPIYAYIEYLKNKHKDILPPRSVNTFSDSIASTIFRLYDHIGDYSSGAEFAEMFLQFYKKIGPGNPYQSANPHFQVKQAFLQDKAGDRKNCITAKPGEVCMGRATKVLIDSEYFPW